jgi:hypothetical protein
VTASPAAQLLPKPSPVVVPSAHLRVKVLRRPIEFTQYTSFRFTAHLIESGIDPIDRDGRRLPVDRLMALLSWR